MKKYRIAECSEWYGSQWKRDERVFWSFEEAKSAIIREYVDYLKVKNFDFYKENYASFKFWGSDILHYVKIEEIEENVKISYVAIGSVRGECGHRHRTLAGAQKCLKRDQRDCKIAGGYSDRVIMAIEGDEMRRLEKWEREALEIEGGES